MLLLNAIILVIFKANQFKIINLKTKIIVVLYVLNQTSYY